MSSTTQTSDLPKILTTERLILRLNDLENEDDNQKIIAVYNDESAGMGGNTRVGINSTADVLAKHAAQGPRQEFCTKAIAPKSIFHLTFLKDENGQEGEFLGFIGMNFRREMPYPDLGYAFFSTSWGKGYAAEAGREALRFWREEVGVKEVFCGTLEGNGKSQRCGERIGFVKGGRFVVEFGAEGGDRKEAMAVALVLPGMIWREFDEKGERVRIFPTVGTETEEQKRDGLRVNE